MDEKKYSPKKYLRRLFARNMAQQIHFSNIHPSISPTGSLAIYNSDRKGGILNKFARKGMITTKFAELAQTKIPKEKTEQEKSDDIIKPLIRTITHSYLLQNEGKILPSQLHEVFKQNGIEHLAPDFADLQGRKMPLHIADEEFLNQLSKHHEDPRSLKRAKDRFVAEHLESAYDLKNMEHEERKKAAIDAQQLWEDLGKQKEYSSLSDKTKHKLYKMSTDYLSDLELGLGEGGWQDSFDNIKEDYDKMIDEHKILLDSPDSRVSSRAKLSLNRLQKEKNNFIQYAEDELVALKYLHLKQVLPQSEIEDDEKVEESPPEEIPTIAGSVTTPYESTEIPEKITMPPLIRSTGVSVPSEEEPAPAMPRPVGRPFSAAKTSTKKQAVAEKSEPEYETAATTDAEGVDLPAEMASIKPPKSEIIKQIGQIRGTNFKDNKKLEALLNSAPDPYELLQQLPSDIKLKSLKQVSSWVDNKLSKQFKFKSTNKNIKALARYIMFTNPQIQRETTTRSLRNLPKVEAKKTGTKIKFKS